jgi:hypothetical protein
MVPYPALRPQRRPACWAKICRPFGAGCQIEAQVSPNDGRTWGTGPKGREAWVDYRANENATN